MSLRLARERVALVGRNGVGKSTLLAVLAGLVEAQSGRVKTSSEPHFLAQAPADAAGRMSHGELRRRALAEAKASGAEILLLDEPSEALDEEAVSWLRSWLKEWPGCVVLASHDRRPCTEPERIAKLLLAHKFPLALAERPLCSLSPGERARAALICLFRRTPALEMLILDEPTYGLDLVGQRAMTNALCAWPGGLVVASHDRAFLSELRLDVSIELSASGALVRKI